MALALGKRAWNTIWLPVRTVGTVLYWWLDTINTVVTLPKQAFEIVSNTTGQIKDVFNNAWNTWKRYNKLVNVPLSPFIATWTAIEWAVRAVVNPSWNAITHTRDVLWNTFVNVWNSVKWTLSDKPVSDFKYEHLKTSQIGTKNYVSKRQWISSGTKKAETKKDDKSKTETKLVDEATKLRITKLEESNNNMLSILQKMQHEQSETNKKLLELLSARKEDGGKTIKWDPKKWSKDKTLWERPWKSIETKKWEIDEDYEEENEKIAA